MCLGYRGNMIKESFLNYEAMNNDFSICLGSQNCITYHEDHREQDFKVTLAETGSESITGGRVKRVEKYIDDRDNFMVTYWDGVTDVDISKLVDFQKSHGKLATVMTVRPISRFGILDVDNSGSVREFVEKPQVEASASAGYMILNRRIFYWEEDECVLEQEPLQRLAAEGQLMAYRHGGLFFVMDTYREYKYLNELWENGEAPWKVWE